MVTGFSPRSNNITIYSSPGYESDKDLLSKLGKVKHGKSCLYIKTSEDIDMKILKQIISEGYNKITGTHVDYKK